MSYPGSLADGRHTTTEGHRGALWACAQNSATPTASLQPQTHRWFAKVDKPPTENIRDGGCLLALVDGLFRLFFLVARRLPRSGPLTIAPLLIPPTLSSPYQTL